MKGLKRNTKMIIAFILGLVIASGGVYAATTITGSSVTYSNTKSELKSTNVQGAIDELYEKADAGKVINKADKFVAAYTYNETSGASNYCVTGKEETCQRITCYKTKTANSCPAGTIIKYKVNDTTIVNFHVMFDERNTITMQTQRSIVYNTPWCNKEDYLKAGGIETDWNKYEYGRTEKGPITSIHALENATGGWNNVNDQIYTLGTTSFSGKGVYTGCDNNLNCTINSYTLSERTAKARMLTTQEAKELGCRFESDSCPIWLVNYLNKSSNGKTKDPASSGYYNLSNAADTVMYNSSRINNYGSSNYGGANVPNDIRAVVQVSK